ncbi:hypothetical protein [Vibrio sp. SCSIO 43136]|uniref:tetratricopeptide repeat protein n=1 Tax=Vibrio sp. SCSIO 43136 TaxID=2819101 RepID=UPI002074B7C8|nr:hypothetical protein [Vibrio sp. SCSIO 43136]USD67015.1 hypothetical protein J4N39_20475 [Vibrio sp. SCSIO 43136]
MKMMKRMLVLGVCLGMACSVSANELSQFVAGKIQQAQKYQQEDNLVEAVRVLEALEPSRSYDQAFVARMLGVYFWQHGDSKGAILQLEKAVASGVLGDEYAWKTQRMLADLYLNEREFKSALGHYEALLTTAPESEKTELYLRITQSNFQLKQWSHVISNANHFKRSNRVWTVPVLSLKLASELEQKQFKDGIKTLDQLLLLEPDKLAWWQQQAGLYMQIGDQKRALQVLALAQRQGVDLSVTYLRTMAQLYASQGMPERAARQMRAVVESDTSNVKWLVEQATYWQMAKEWQQSIEVWKVAAKLDKQHQWPLAQLLLQQGENQAALAVLEKITKPTADQQLAKTRAYYKLKQNHQALRYAQLAYKQSPSQGAKAWIDYLSTVTQ